MLPALVERVRSLRANIRSHKQAFAAITRFRSRVDRRAQLIRLDNRLNRDLDELDVLFALLRSGQPTDQVG